jgi:hypothetical protein
MSIFKKIMSAQEYERDGQKRTSWKEVGIISQNSKGNMFMSLHHLPGVRFNLFDPDPPKEGQAAPARSVEDLDDNLPNW